MKEKSFSKTIVTLVIILNIMFTLSVLGLSYLGMPVPDSLIIAWYGWTTVELWQLATIKRKDIETEKGEWEE